MTILTLQKKNPKKRSGFFLKIGPIARQIDAACLGFTQKKNCNVALFFLIILLPSDCGDGWTSSHISIFIIHLLFFVPLVQVGLYNLLYNNRNVYLMRHWHSFFNIFFTTSIWNRHTTDVHRIPKNENCFDFPPVWIRWTWGRNLGSCFVVVEVVFSAS